MRASNSHVDLGSSSIEREDASFTMRNDVWRNGTPEYAAPEMLTRDVPGVAELRRSPSVDVYALCSVLYEMYSGRTPFDVASSPLASPYALKTEGEPAPLEPACPEDEPLVEAITAGIHARQGSARTRPSCSGACTPGAGARSTSRTARRSRASSRGQWPRERISRWRGSRPRASRAQGGRRARSAPRPAQAASARQESLMRTSRRPSKNDEKGQSLFVILRRARVPRGTSEHPRPPHARHRGVRASAAVGAYTLPEVPLRGPVKITLS